MVNGSEPFRLRTAPVTRPAATAAIVQIEPAVDRGGSAARCRRPRLLRVQPIAEPFRKPRRTRRNPRRPTRRQPAATRARSRFRPSSRATAWYSKLVSELSSNPTVAAWLATDDLIRNFAVVVTNIAAEEPPGVHVKQVRPKGPFQIIERNGQMTIDPRSYQRYTPIASAVGALDPDGCARLYATLKPLMEKAHQDLGYKSVVRRGFRAGHRRAALDADAEGSGACRAARHRVCVRGSEAGGAVAGAEASSALRTGQRSSGAAGAAEHRRRGGHTQGAAAEIVRGLLYSSLTAFSTSSAWPSTFTLSHRRATLPSPSMRYVVRTLPMNLRPYRDFCCQTPYFSATA